MNLTKRCTILLLVLQLAACATTPTDRDDATTPATDAGPGSDEAALTRLLEQADTLSTPEAEPYFLEAARTLVSMERPGEALELLAPLDLDPLPLPLTADIIILKAELMLMDNRHQGALVELTNPTLSALPRLDRQRQADIRILRARAYENNSAWLAAIRERILVDRMLDADRARQNQEALWDDLQAVPVQRLRQLAENELNFEFQGWYELGIIGRAYRYNLDRQLIELENWQQQWSRHPASENLPGSLQLVESMARERPEQIALLLPLQTNAGTVIRNAFMSAYLNTQEIGGNVPEIRFYDTGGSEDIIALHRRAREEGAAMIIGPLLKENVAQLQSVRDLGVPTLALNTIENGPPASDLLYQFALSPEGEARQIARKAWNDGHRNAAVLSPLQAAGDDFYLRKRNSFIDEWQSLGGRVVADELYQNDYTASIERLLNLSESEFRRQELADTLGRSLAFTPRRRQDVDFILLIAAPGEARQIKPRLGYLYAGNIPVYASQDIYSGLSRPLEDADLNGIVFGESPWLLSTEDELKQETQSLFPQSSARNLRLQAFGVDAFRLYPRLRQLENLPDSTIYGATGMLRLTENREIVRELSWARIEQGQARLVEAGATN